VVGSVRASLVSAVLTENHSARLSRKPADHFFAVFDTLAAFARLFVHAGQLARVRISGKGGKFFPYSRKDFR